MGPSSDIDQKARGAFFTPQDIVDFINAWAIRGGQDKVLEPSFGDAAFLLPAALRLRDLGAKPHIIAQNLVGVELHQPSIDETIKRLNDVGLQARIHNGSFFEQKLDRTFDAVIGNPPYIRYHSFAGESRLSGIEAALSHGVRLSGLASSWAAFTVHAAEHLNDLGRLGLVLPAELLSVNYAAQVRKFLLGRFAKVRLILFEKLVFPGVLEDVVLLLAEGRGSAQSFEVLQAKNAESLKDMTGLTWRGFEPKLHEKWTPALIQEGALAPYNNLLAQSGFAKLANWGETYLGVVTGNNSYFTLSETDVRTHGLGPEDVVQISPPGGRHLRGFEFSTAAWQHLAEDGRRCFLFLPNADAPSVAAKKYIEWGESIGVNKAYKCKVRRPWWRVPQVDVPDLFFTYMNHDRPRLTRNSAGVRILNSIYGVRLRGEVRDVGSKILPIACLNSMTLLGSEIVGRAYGGGLLKHEPREADLLPVPSAQLLNSVKAELELLAPQLSKALRSDQLKEAVALVDKIILEKHLGISFADVSKLRLAREAMFNRRLARAQN